MVRVLHLRVHDDVQNKHDRLVRSHVGGVGEREAFSNRMRRIFEARWPTATVAHRSTADVVVERATSLHARRGELTVSEVLRLLSDCSGRLLSLDEWYAMAERAECSSNKVDASTRDLGQAGVLAARSAPAAAAA